MEGCRQNALGNNWGATMSKGCFFLTVFPLSQATCSCPDHRLHATAAVIFLVEGCGQNALGKNWGDGLATDPAIVQQRGINSAASLFSQLMRRSYLNQVVVAPHVYPPSISSAREETTVSLACWGTVLGASRGLRLVLGLDDICKGPRVRVGTKGFGGKRTEGSPCISSTSSAQDEAPACSGCAAVSSLLLLKVLRACLFWTLVSQVRKSG